MAGVSFEEFSAPPGAELALEPLFGGNILESEGEPDPGGGAEPDPGGGAEQDTPLPPRPRPPRRAEGEGPEGAELRRRRLKLQALGRRCREIRQVNARALQRLRQVQKATRRLQLERRFLMQVLDAHGDRYRQGQLTVLLQDEGGVPAPPPPGNAENEPPERGPAHPERGPAPDRGHAPSERGPAPSEPPGPKRRRRDPRGGRGKGGGAVGGGAAPNSGGQPKGEESTLGPSPSWTPPSPPEKPPRFPKFSGADFD